MELIQYKGIKDLSDSEREILNKLSAEYYTKVKRSLKNDVSLVIHVKTHQKKGDKKEKRKHFSVNIRAIAPTKILEAEDADWDFARAVHKAFRNILNEIKKLFKTDVTRKLHRRRYYK